MAHFFIDFHHGGFFDEMGNYQGVVAEWKCDPDFWSYFEALSLVKEMKYTAMNEMWYKAGEELRLLRDDGGAAEMLTLARDHGKVHLYLVHPIYQPEVIHEIDNGPFDPDVAEAQAQTNENQPTEVQHNESQSNKAQTTEAQPTDFPHSEAEPTENDPIDDQIAEEYFEDDENVSDLRFDDSDDETFLDDEVLISEEVNKEPPKKQKNKGGRPKKKLVNVPRETGQSSVNNGAEDVSSDDMSLSIVKKKKRKFKGSDEECNSSELETEDDDSDDEEKQHYPSFVMPKKMVDFKWVLGSKFSTKDEFKEVVINYSIYNGYDLRYIKNDNTRVRVRCKDTCPWVALCSKLPDEDTWQLRKLVDDHKCPREYRVRFMSSNWLGKKLMPSVRENPSLKLSDITDKAQLKWHADVSKTKAYRARKAAVDLVDGSFKEQFKRLYDYGHEIIRSNPNSTVKITVQPTLQIEEGNEEGYIDRPLLPSFHRMYMCIDGCKQSFSKCRPFIGLDGCFLKGYYGGMILAAVGRDPNEQMMPIAFAAVEGETRDSWTWFLELLIKDLGGQEVCKKITFMSDQQKGLLPSIEELMPGVEQRFCVRHLYSNFRKRYPGKHLKELMWKAAKASYPQAWERTMREIRAVSEEAFKYLFKTSPRFWSKSQFTGNSKCDILVNNMSETFNSVILIPRGKPIVTMFEEIRAYLMGRWVKNRVKFDSLEAGAVLPNIAKKLVKVYEMSRFWMCRPSGLKIYEVYNINQSGEKFTVNLQTMVCTCRLWQLTGIPCCHAVTCYNDRSEDPAKYIPSFYRKEAYVACYQPMIYPTNGENLWEPTPYPDILPPPVKRMPGRPKRSRNKDADERNKSGRPKRSRDKDADERNDPSLVTRRKMQNKCSICKNPGHKKGSCKLAQPQPSTTQTQPSTTQPQPSTNAQPATAQISQPKKRKKPATASSQPPPTAKKTPTAKKNATSSSQPPPTATAKKNATSPSQPPPTSTAKKNVTSSSQPPSTAKINATTSSQHTATSSLFKEGTTSTMQPSRPKLQTRRAMS